VYLTVFSPGGTVVYAESRAHDDASIVSYDWGDYAGGAHYVYRERISVLDGASSANGVFSFVLAIDDNTGADLITSRYGHFQIVNSPLDASLDSTGLATAYAASCLDSLGKSMDSLESLCARQVKVLDSLGKIIDSLESQASWVGTLRGDSTEEAVFRRLAVRANGDDSAFVVQGAGSGVGFCARGGSTGGHGLVAISSSGHGGFFTSSAPAFAGLSAQGNSGSHGARFYGQAGWGQGLIIGADSSDGVQIYGGDGANRHAVDILAGTDITGALVGQHGIRIAATGADARGVYVSSDSSYGLAIDGGDGYADIVATTLGTVTPTDTTAGGESIAVKPDSWSSDDSVAYQGAASGLTAANVADAVWDEQQTEHVTAGSFGKYLDADISGLGSGSGLYAYEIVVCVSTTGTPVPYARLAVRNTNQTTLLATGTSDATGSAVFQLDSDSFTVVAAATGYVFSGYDTIAVFASGTDTITGYAFDPGSPSSPDLCRVYGYVADLFGTPEIGARVSAHLPRGVTRSGNLIISPFTVSAETDSTGYFYLDLIPSSLLAGDNITYEIAIARRDGAILRKRITVPDQPQWLLTW
jgi:hypothetical protein